MTPDIRLRRMARQEAFSRVPVLVAPRAQAVLDGARVSFIWKPVRYASGYRLQVARQPSFEELVYESDELNRTEYTLRNELPIDDDTYFWRVLATDEDGVVHGEDNIESFVSSTADAAGRHIAQPDQDEEFGPIGRIFHGAVVEAAAEVSDSPRWAQEEHELGVEHEGVEAGQILGFVLATAVALGLAVFTLFQYVDITAQAVRIEATGRSGYPELLENRLNAIERLTQYDVVEGEEGRYRIPIDRAMELMTGEDRTDADYSRELDFGHQN